MIHRCIFRGSRGVNFQNLPCTANHGGGSRKTFTIHLFTLFRTGGGMSYTSLLFLAVISNPATPRRNIYNNFKSLMPSNFVKFIYYIVHILLIPAQIKRLSISSSHQVQNGGMGRFWRRPPPCKFLGTPLCTLFPSDLKSLI